MEKPRKKWKYYIIFLVIILLFIAALRSGFLHLSFGRGEEEHPKEIISVSTLEQIIDASELSTFTAVYNGIANVKNPDNPGQIDYYVSYEATVDVGVDFKQVEVNVDNEAKIVRINIPAVEITGVHVDIASLDYIFLNDKANTSSVSQEAYKACLADAEAESKKQDKIFELARQNAQNVLEALTSPFIEQIDAGYELRFE